MYTSLPETKKPEVLVTPPTLIAGHYLNHH